MKTTPKTPREAHRTLADLKPNKDPKGGALNAYLTLTGPKQGQIKGSVTQKSP